MHDEVITEAPDTDDVTPTPASPHCFPPTRLAPDLPLAAGALCLPLQKGLTMIDAPSSAKF